MRRRRLVAGIVALAIVAAVTAWWLWPDPLTSEEQQLVGVWQTHLFNPRNPWIVEFTAGRQLRYWTRGKPRGTWPAHGEWRIRDGRLATDFGGPSLDPGYLFHRMTRAVRSREPDPLVSITADEVALEYPNGQRYTWTRAKTD